MNPLLNGIYWGLFLTILVGPIIFALIQAGVERGFRAGAMIGLGIWLSDIMYILLAYFGVYYLTKATEWQGFELTLGIAGGITLIILGIVTILGKPPKMDKKERVSGGYLSLWVKGFLINTLNPFTVFFWVMITTTIVADKYADGHGAGWFFGGILGTVILTDCLKILMAKGLRRWLNRKHILLVRRISGIALIVFGIVLMVRVLI